MPAVSEEQRRLFAIAEHNPEKLYKKNRGLLNLGRKKLHEFASTKGLHRVKKRKTARVSRRKLDVGRRKSA